MKNEHKSIMVVIVFVILVLAVIVIIFLNIEEPENKKIEYNYFVFEEIAGLWQTSLVQNGKSYFAIFRFNPEQTEDVYITGNFSGFKKSPIYLTFDPNASSEEFKYLALATSELSLHLIRGLNLEVEAACTADETPACEDRPIITCDSNESVIYLVPKMPTQITLKGSCVTLSGDKLDLLKSVDRILFQWYRIVR